MNGQNKQRDRPGFWGRWAAGIAMIYVPAGVIAGGVACIAGGVLTALDGGDAS